ncbi:MAG TPA: hypothetical protein VGB65_11810 [Allosphingosinicella sp.]|jgi:hypothetical protein
MGLRIALKWLVKAVPVVVANGPTIVDMVRQIRAALKTPKPKRAEPAASPAEAG